MLPFGSFEFLILMAMFIATIGVCKLFLKDATYKYVLLALNASFLIFFFPRPLHFMVLIGWSYFGVWLFSDVLKPAKKIWGILFLLLPMLLVKFDIKVNFYPFEFNAILLFAGLSYASFRVVGYYMDKAPGEKMAGAVDWFNFLSFTPTLLIGPIERFGRFKASQDTGFTSLTEDNFVAGWQAFVKGLAFKYILAEELGRLWYDLYPEPGQGFAYHWASMYEWYFYLFFDFAGYSFMALGIGKMMGMSVPVNFGNPFVAVNPQDFWRRFHISLGDWLKDYFFTPLYLFLTRKKRLKPYPITRQNIALILTFTLMGCWNGFEKHFVLSGLLFGVYSAVHNTYVMQCRKQGRDVVFGKLSPTVVKIISIFVTFHLIAFALYIFSGLFI